MLKIIVPATELFDSRTNRFYHTKEQSLTLEHSLVSLSKWESRWKKPFISQKEKTNEELIDYVRCMTITQNVSPLVYQCLNKDNFKAITDYMNDTMTATTFRNRPGGSSHEIVTAEVIYYWMTRFGIPFDPCQKWHLNRLLTLIRVCNEKSQPGKKMSASEIARENRALNSARRKMLHSKG